MRQRNDSGVEPAVEAIRRISATLFGNAYRLEVIAAIAKAEHGVVYKRELAHSLKVADNLIISTLGALEESQLLQKLPRPRGQSIQEYQRLDEDHPIWSSCVSIVEGVRNRA